MSWHVATLIKEWAQYIVPIHFKFFCRGLIYHARGFTGLTLMLLLQHQMRMKILIQESISPDIQSKMKNKKRLY